MKKLIALICALTLMLSFASVFAKFFVELLLNCQ